MGKLKAAKPKAGSARPKKRPTKAHKEKAIGSPPQLVNRGSKKQQKAQKNVGKTRQNAAERLIQALKDGRQYSQTAV